MLGLANTWMEDNLGLPGTTDANRGAVKKNTENTNSMHKDQI